MIYDNEYLKSRISETECDDLSSIVFSNNEKCKRIIANALSEVRLLIGEAMKTDNVAFVLANGCSIYAGSKATIELKDEKIDDKYSLIKEDLACVLSNDVESELNSLGALKDYYATTNKKKELELVENYISEKKNELLSNYVLGLDYNKLILHNTLILKLRAYGVLSKTSFYTPNYDLAVEYSLDNLHIEYNNGFTGFVNRTFNIASFTSRKPNIIKIHGSLNWKYDSSCGQIVEIQPAFENGKISHSSFDDSIIYPTSEKLFKTYNAPYSELLRYMLNDLQEKRNAVFVIGYKYGDAHINDVLLKAMSNPNNVFFFYDYDNDENCEFIAKVKELERTITNIHIFSGKYLSDFSTFVNYMLPALAEKTDQEKITELLKKVLPNGNN